MKKKYNIVESNTEPNIEDLWLKGKSIKKFTSKGWKNINGIIDQDTPVKEELSGEERIPILDGDEGKATTVQNLISEHIIPDIPSKLSDLENDIYAGKFAFIDGTFSGDPTISSSVEFTIKDPTFFRKVIEHNSGYIGFYLKPNSYTSLVFTRGYSYYYQQSGAVFICHGVKGNVGSQAMQDGIYYITIITTAPSKLVINSTRNFTTENIITFTKNKNQNLKTLQTLNTSRTYACMYIDYITDLKINYIGEYYNGVITTFQKGKIVKYNVSFDDGSITELSSFDPDLVMLDLERVSPEAEGDTDDIIVTRALNLEKLQKTLTLPFLATMDYGIGIGRFINGNGGEINVTYTTGGNGHYTIGTDGSIVKDDNYVPEITYDYQAYKNAGGTKTQEEFYAKLVTLIDV